MLELVFQVGEDRYVILCRHVEKIVPKVSLQKAAHFPPIFAGLLNFGGRLVPILDFSQVTKKRNSPDSYHCRIILLKNPNPTGKTDLLGVMGEYVTKIFEVEKEEEIETALQGAGVPFLGRVLSRGEYVVQEVLVTELFSLVERHSTEDATRGGCP